MRHQPLMIRQLSFAFDAAPEPAPPDHVLSPPGNAAPVAFSPVFVRHPRARRYVIRVLADATVRVTVPRWGSKHEAAAFAQREHGWIAKQLRRLRSDEARRRESGQADDWARAVTASNGQPLTEREIIERARSELVPRLNELAAMYGLTVARVSIRNQRSRWGSCSPRGHICLNWRLISLPHWVRDYVLVHELMHLKRMDHSRRFWKLVEKACPDFQLARRYLRDHSSALATTVRGR